MIRKKLAALAMAAFISLSAAAMPVSAVGLGNSGNYTCFDYYDGTMYRDSTYSVAEIGGEKTLVNFVVTDYMEDGTYYFNAAQVADINVEKVLKNAISPDKYDYYDIVDFKVSNEKNTPYYPWMRILLSSERAVGYNCIFVVNDDYSLYKSRLYRYNNTKINSVVFENLGKTRFVLMKLKEDVDLQSLDEDPMEKVISLPVPPSPQNPIDTGTGIIPMPTPYPVPSGKPVEPDGRTTDTSKPLPDGDSPDPKDIQESKTNDQEISDPETSVETGDVVSEVSEESSEIVSEKSEESVSVSEDTSVSKPQPAKEGVKTGDTAPTAAVLGTVGAAALLTGIVASKKKRISKDK